MGIHRTVINHPVLMRSDHRLFCNAHFFADCHTPHWRDGVQMSGGGASEKWSGSRSRDGGVEAKDTSEAELALYCLVFLFESHCPFVVMFISVVTYYILFS